MKTKVYKFEEIKVLKNKNYINQYITARKLSNVYHTHDFYEFVIINNGSCTQLINGKQYLLNKDGFALLCPNEAHSTLDQSDDISLFSISVKQKEFEEIANVLDTTLLKRLHEEKVIINEIPNIHRNINLFCTENIENCAEYECRLLLTYLLTLVIKIFQNKISQLPKNVQYALKQIKKPEYLKGGVASLVELSGYSRSQLARIIAKEFKTTLHSYIYDLKLNMAYNDIVLSNESLEDICENLGYSSFSHFNQIFKKRYEITPAQLRKKHRLWTA